MKKIILGLLVAVMAFSACAFADDIKQVTSETILYIKATHTVPENSFTNFTVFSNDSAKMKSQLISFLRTCQPYNENVNFNFFGFDASVNIHSNGIVNNKCTYEFSGKVNSIPDSIPSSPKMSNAELLTMEPKVSCEFSQEQLNALVNFVNEFMNEMDYKKPGFSKEQAKRNLKNKLANDTVINEMFKEGKACRLVSYKKESL